MEILLNVNRLVNQPQAEVRQKDAIISAMESFISTFASPQSNMGSEYEQDDMRPLLTFIRLSTLPVEVEVLTAKCLKILLRKQLNRTLIGKQGIISIIKTLVRQTENKTSAVAEIGNVVVNTCYNGDNVQLFLDEGGLPPLTKLLQSRDPVVQSSILAALQGICYVPIGRQILLRHDPETIKIITYFLSSHDDYVRARASGAIHNISADSQSIRILRETYCIPTIISLLHDPVIETCQSCAGLLQNMSREIRSKEMILESEAVTPLTELLFGSDIQCQVAAVGALFNLLSSVDDTDTETQTETERERDRETERNTEPVTISLINHTTEKKVALKELLSQGLMIGALQSCLFDVSPSQDATRNIDAVAAAQAITNTKNEIQNLAKIRRTSRRTSK